MNKFLLLIVILLFSCKNGDDRLEKVLLMSGQNRHELEKVLAHYSKNKADSLKLRAVKFLIENMPGHYTCSSDFINKYIQQIDSLNPNLSFWVKPYLYHLPLENELIEEEDRDYDIHCITAKYLIEHIDYKFKIREIITWRDEIDFDVFCEYILPYRSYTEPLDIMSSEICNNVILNLSNEIQKKEYENLRMTDIRGYVAEKVFKGNNNGSIRSPSNYSINIANCFIFSNATVEKMKCIGIPAMTDFVPFWATGNSNHAWCNFVDKYSVYLAIGEGDRTGTSKIYRNTFSHNPAPENDGNLIPKLFTPFIKDVTSEYVKTEEVKIKYDRSIKNGYLAVFNTLEWQPIAWSVVKRGNAIFKNLGKGIVYLPVYYVKDEMQYADYPFILDFNGNVKKIIPNREKRQKLHLTRKHILQPYKFPWSDNLDSLIMLGSNDSLFTKYDTTGVFIKNPLALSWELKNNLECDFRYWRLVEANNGIVSVAELLFIDKNEKRLSLRLKHKQLNDQYCNDLTMKIQDSNPESYATLRSDITIDIGEPLAISCVKILPRNDENDIYPNNIYELFYFDKDGWVSVDVKMTTNYFVEFEDVPSEAIYWLRNHSKGKEERIFSRSLKTH